MPDFHKILNHNRNIKFVNCLFESVNIIGFNYDFLHQEVPFVTLTNSKLIDSLLLSYLSKLMDSKVFSWIDGFVCYNTSLNNSIIKGSSLRLDKLENIFIKDSNFFNSSFYRDDSDLY